MNNQERQQKLDQELEAIDRYIEEVTETLLILKIRRQMLEQRLGRLAMDD